MRIAEFSWKFTTSLSFQRDRLHESSRACLVWAPSQHVFKGLSRSGWETLLVLPQLSLTGNSWPAFFSDTRSGRVQYFAVVKLLMSTALLGEFCTADCVFREGSGLGARTRRLVRPTCRNANAIAAIWLPKVLVLQLNALAIYTATATGRLAAPRFHLARLFRQTA